MTEERILADISNWAWIGLKNEEDMIVISTFKQPTEVLTYYENGMLVPIVRDTPVTLKYKNEKIDCIFYDFSVDWNTIGSPYIVRFKPINLNNGLAFIHNTVLEAYGQPKNAGDIIYATVERMEYD